MNLKNTILLYGKYWLLKKSFIWIDKQKFHITIFVAFPLSAQMQPYDQHCPNEKILLNVFPQFSWQWVWVKKGLHVWELITYMPRIPVKGNNKIECSL